MAIIGAGFTGIFASTHSIGYGFTTTVFEAGGRDALGGIWNFCPSVDRRTRHLDRQQIVGQLRKLWEEYGLDQRTKFNTPVNRLYKDNSGKWVVNDISHGQFDGVIVAIGTCGDPQIPSLPNRDRFNGDILHVSQLRGKRVKNKNVLVVCGDASVMDALEFVATGDAAKAYILARSDACTTPSSRFIDAMLSLDLFDVSTWLSWIPAGPLNLFLYRNLLKISLGNAEVARGSFARARLATDKLLDFLRSGRAELLDADILSFEGKGVRFEHRPPGGPRGGLGQERLVEADMCVVASGYQAPSLHFLPEDCLQEPYTPPNWYLQAFPPTHTWIFAPSTARIPMLLAPWGSTTSQFIRASC
ncbi:hypothetical protein LTR46_011671 [Exophiala xenobiotica]|nr:hypothetical protein LTR46_011671 [Exophiala xenobiotica]